MTRSDDIRDDPDWKRWEEEVLTELVPKIDGSAASIMLHSGTVDAKFAVELGVSILLDKPILALVQPGGDVPAKLALVADKIVYADMYTEEGRAHFQRELEAFMELLP